MRRLHDNGQNYHPAYVAYQNLTTPEIFVANDLCVRYNINKDYWISYNIAHPIEEKNESSGALTIGSGISVFLALLLIELALLI